MLIAGLSLTSCFVKEDRTPCPCWLEVDLSNVSEKSVVLSGWMNELLFRGPVSPSDYPDLYEVTVPRGEVYVTALGKNNDILNPTNLLVPEGRQPVCPLCKTEHQLRNRDRCGHITQAVCNRSPDNADSRRAEDISL